MNEIGTGESYSNTPKKSGERRRNEMNKKEFLDKYKGKAVHCPTEDLANEFLGLAFSFGIEWLSGSKENNKWHLYTIETCYIIGIYNKLTFGDVDYLKSENYEIIEFKKEKTMTVKNILLYVFISILATLSMVTCILLVTARQANKNTLEYWCTQELIAEHDPHYNIVGCIVQSTTARNQTWYLSETMKEFNETYSQEMDTPVNVALMEITVLYIDNDWQTVYKRDYLCCVAYQSYAKSLYQEDIVEINFKMIDN